MSHVFGETLHSICQSWIEYSSWIGYSRRVLLHDCSMPFICKETKTGREGEEVGKRVRREKMICI